MESKTKHTSSKHVKYKDPTRQKEEEEHKTKADENDNVEDEKEKQMFLKLEKENFVKRFAPYNKPALNVVVGLVCSMI